MSTQTSNLSKNVFFVILAAGAEHNEHSWMNLSGVPLDVKANDFSMNQFHIEWTDRLPFAFMFSAETMVDLAWVYCETFFTQINDHAQAPTTASLLTRNHGFVPSQIRLMKYTILLDGTHIDGEVIKSMDITVQSQKAA